MKSTATSEANRTKRTLVEHALSDLLTSGLQRGFHGTLAVEIVVQDGTIQSVRQTEERWRR